MGGSLLNVHRTQFIPTHGREQPSSRPWRALSSRSGGLLKQIEEAMGKPVNRAADGSDNPFAAQADDGQVLEERLRHMIAGGRRRSSSSRRPPGSTCTRRTRTRSWSGAC